MCKNCFIAILLFFSFCVKAQPTVFAKFYGGHGYEEGIATFPLLNGELLLIGNSSVYNTNSTDVWVIWTDSAGNFIKHNTYGTWNFEKITNTIQTKDGNIYMIGSTYQNQLKGYDVYLLGIKQNGAILCEKYFGGNDWDFGNSIVQDSDSSLVILSQTQSYGVTSPKLMLWKTNLIGDSISSKIIPSNTEDFGQEIKSIDTTSYVIGGYSTSNVSQTRNAFILRLNQNLDTINRINFDFTRDSQINSVLINPDSTITFVGYIRDTLGMRQGWLRKIDSIGNTKFNHDLIQTQDNQIYRIIRNQYGRYFTIGTSKVWTNGEEDYLVSELNSDGWWTNGCSYGSTKSDIPNNIIIDTLDFQSLIITGTSSNKDMPITSLFLVKADSSLQAITTNALVVISGIENQKNQKSITVFPNPITNNLSIELNGSVENAEVFVYDIIGKQVMNAKIANAISNINTSTLPNGVYFLKIVSECKTLYVSKVIKN